jgi:hypothetical protein
MVECDDGWLYTLSDVGCSAMLGQRNAIMSRHSSRDMLPSGGTRGRVKDKQLSGARVRLPISYLSWRRPDDLSSANSPSRGTHAMCSGQVTSPLKAYREYDDK